MGHGVPPEGARVWVWRNLHMPGRVFSVRERGCSTVGWWVRELHLDDVDLVVQPGGRARARQQGWRNVHAHARGTVGGPVDGRDWELVTYSPFSETPWFTLGCGAAVAGAAHARLDAAGLWLAGPRPAVT